MVEQQLTLSRIYTFFHLFLPYLTPSLCFPVVILFHNLSCCNDRLRQRALCWCLWAEPLRDWDKAELTCGFSCVTLSFETSLQEMGEKGRKGLFLQRRWPPLHFTSQLLLTCSCWLLPWGASSNKTTLFLQTSHWGNETAYSPWGHVKKQNNRMKHKHHTALQWRDDKLDVWTLLKLQSHSATSYSSEKYNPPPLTSTDRCARGKLP